ncbi:hypothetical protein C8T65DRAFT_700609 [Cerioporus squamosus]|nr:hypothetical protein C8T65DRAFT_700609 [Cerioporus squamosus]
MPLPSLPLGLTYYILSESYMPEHECRRTLLALESARPGSHRALSRTHRVDDIEFKAVFRYAAFVEGGLGSEDIVWHLHTDSEARDSLCSRQQAPLTLWIDGSPAFLYRFLPWFVEQLSEWTTAPAPAVRLLDALGPYPLLRKLTMTIPIAYQRNQYAGYAGDVEGISFAHLANLTNLVVVQPGMRILTLVPRVHCWNAGRGWLPVLRGRLEQLDSVLDELASMAAGGASRLGDSTGSAGGEVSGVQDSRVTEEEIDNTVRSKLKLSAIRGIVNGRKTTHLGARSVPHEQRRR